MSDAFKPGTYRPIDITKDERRLFKAARGLLAAPGGWTQNANARLPDGSPYDPETGRLLGATHPDAGSFCLTGSIWCARQRLGIDPQIIIDAEYSLLAIVEGNHQGTAGEQLVRWNDSPGRTQAEVVGALDAVLAGGTRGRE